MICDKEEVIPLPDSNNQQLNDGSVQITCTWDKPSELEEYIGKLQTAAERLTTDNRRLRHCHAILVDKITVLMSVDLLRQQQRWKDALADIRQMMATLVQEGFSAGNMRPWQQHWDHQLYKLLEHQYQLGLEALNEHLPEIKVELIFRRRNYLGGSKWLGTGLRTG